MEKKHICSICRKLFDNGLSLGGHITAAHSEKSECAVCKKQISRQAFKRHVNICKQIYCLFCNKQISKRKKFCNSSCSAKFNLPKRIHKEETKKKISKSLSGRIINTELYSVNNCSICGLSFERKKNKKETCSWACSRKLAAPKIAAAVKGKVGGYKNFGGKGKGGYYKNEWYDSSWELKLAKSLDEKNILFRRNTGLYKFPYIDLKGRNRNYYPDFFFPETNQFLEIKGYWTTETKHKIKSSMEINPELKNLIILESLEEIDKFCTNYHNNDTASLV